MKIQTRKLKKKIHQDTKINVNLCNLEYFHTNIENIK